VTHISKVSAQAYLNEQTGFRAQRDIGWQLQRELQDEELTVYEVDRVPGWMLERLISAPNPKRGARKGKPG
jgi:hypothetical protein